MLIHDICRNIYFLCSAKEQPRNMLITSIATMYGTKFVSANCFKSMLKSILLASAQSVTQLLVTTKNITPATTQIHVQMRLSLLLRSGSRCITRSVKPSSATSMVFSAKNAPSRRLSSSRSMLLFFLSFSISVLSQITCEFRFSTRKMRLHRTFRHIRYVGYLVYPITINELQGNTGALGGLQQTHRIIYIEVQLHVAL